MEIVEIWQNFEKKRNTDHDFPPRYMWAENVKSIFSHSDPIT